MSDMQDLIVRELNQMAEFESQKDLLGLSKQEAIDAILTPELVAQIEAINLEFAPKEEEAGKKIADLKKQIGVDVKSFGESVKGKHLHAVYGVRTSWDNAALRGYAADKPELLQFKKETKSVTIRRLKND